MQTADIRSNSTQLTDEGISGGLGLHIRGAVANHHHRGQAQLSLELLHHHRLAAVPANSWKTGEEMQQGCLEKGFERKHTYEYKK